jgi:hypothetical protein
MTTIAVQLEENEFGHSLGTRENDRMPNVNRERSPFDASADTHETAMVKIWSQLDQLRALFDLSAGP